MVFESVRAVANKYYDFKSKREFLVNISETEGGYRSDSKMPKYITHKFRQKIEKDHPQIKLVEENQDCKAKVHLFEKLGKPNLFVSLLDNRNNSFYSNTYELSADEFSGAEYENFESKSIDIKKTAYLQISYQCDGFNETEKNSWRSMNYSTGTLYRGTSLKKAYYPIEQECYINGKIYTASAEKVFFNEKVAPGNYKVTLTFKGAVWGEDTKQQSIITGKMSKSFDLDIGDNETQNVQVHFSYNSKEGKIKILPFGYLSYYDKDGKFLRSSDEREEQFVFPATELGKISALISKYSIDEIIEVLVYRGIVTTQVGNEFRELNGRPSVQYVNNKTIYLDLKKKGLTVEDVETLILHNRKQREENLKQKEEEDLARKEAAEERRRKAEEERKRKEIEESIRAYEKEMRQREELAAKEKRMEEERRKYMARLEEDRKTQTLPSQYQFKIGKYFRRILKDPNSLEISSISKPFQVVLEDYYRDLSPGNIVWKCEVCYNAKNAFGGYVGVQCQDVIFRDGEVIDSY